MLAWREYVIMGVALAVSAVLGAVISRYVRDGGSIVFTYVVGVLSITVWAMAFQESDDELNNGVPLL